jgi:hypothetical protein
MDAVSELPEQPPPDLDGETSLAATPGADQRDQSNRGQQLFDLGDLPLASDEGR